MKHTIRGKRVTVHQGDALAVLRTMPDASVDAIVTDPPYGLGFMGQKWDTYANGTGRAKSAGAKFDHVGGNHNPSSSADASRTRRVEAQRFGVWCEGWAAECLRVLKPGGHMLAFGGTRTWHRLACAVEDAGFEVRDSMAWLYGSGFPKSLDVSKAIDKAAGATPDAETWQGWGTALKPAFEPIVVARKPLTGTVAANVLAHGTGALNIDRCRVETTDSLGGGAEKVTTAAQKGDEGWARPWMSNEAAQSAHAERVRANVAKAEGLGRWPANVVLDESQAAELDAQAPRAGAAAPVRGSEPSAAVEPGTITNARGRVAGAFHADQGGASRFFYVAKAPKRERPVDPDGKGHPTVKPLTLMRWLVRLVTPPGGTVLDPFAGSGTTGEACILEGFPCILIERGAEYLPLIGQRVARAVPPEPTLGGDL